MRHAINCLLGLALCASIGPCAMAQGCGLDMTPHYSAYATESTDATNVYTSVLSDGYADFQPSAGCTGQGVTHQPRAYNVIGTTGGWGYGTASCITCYLSYQNDQQVAYNLAGEDDFPPWNWEGEVFCSVAGVFFSEGPGPFPTNFTLSSAVDAGGGDLHMVWAWESSTGNLGDLTQCTVSEFVTYPGPDSPPGYYPWPTPFPATSTADPTTGSVPATDGTAADDHDLNGKFDTDFRKPYFANSFVADQQIGYVCTYDLGSVSGTLYGPAAITRSVNQNGSWYFTVSQPVDGVYYSAEINPLP
jgi:hypothetical protein